jgi:microcystin-dependent protein
MGGWDCKDNKTIEWKGDIKAENFIGNTNGSLGGSPVGSIIMYPSMISPPGWLNCTGDLIPVANYPELFAVIGYQYGGSGLNFQLPDFQGIFPRGAGATGNTKLSDANGVAFNSSIGTYQNDKMQGHWHSIFRLGGAGATTTVASVASAATGTPSTDFSDRVLVKDAITDGTNGAPRIGTETNPANLSINFMIKYTAY